MSDFKHEAQLELFRKEVMPKYRVRTDYINNASVPFHVEPSRTLSSITRLPLASVRGISREEKFHLYTFTQKVKISLRGLYNQFTGLFKTKPLTATERAAKAYLDPEMTIAKVYGRNN